MTITLIITSEIRGSSIKKEALVFHPFFLFLLPFGFLFHFFLSVSLFQFPLSLSLSYSTPHLTPKSFFISVFPSHFKPYLCHLPLPPFIFLKLFPLPLRYPLFSSHFNFHFKPCLPFSSLTHPLLLFRFPFPISPVFISLPPLPFSLSLLFPFPFLSPSPPLFSLPLQPSFFTLHVILICL